MVKKIIIAGLLLQSFLAFSSGNNTSDKDNKVIHLNPKTKKATHLNKDYSNTLSNDNKVIHLNAKQKQTQKTTEKLSEKELQQKNDSDFLRLKELLTHPFSFNKQAKLEQLFKEGVSPNSKDLLGNPMLFRFIKAQKPDLVHAFLDHPELNIHMVDSANSNIIHYIMSYFQTNKHIKNGETMRLLEKAQKLGADFYHINNINNMLVDHLELEKGRVRSAGQSIELPKPTHNGTWFNVENVFARNRYSYEPSPEQIKLIENRIKKFDGTTGELNPEQKDKLELFLSKGFHKLDLSANSEYKKYKKIAFNIITNYYRTEFHYLDIISVFEGKLSPELLIWFYGKGFLDKLEKASESIYVRYAIEHVQNIQKLNKPSCAKLFGS